MISHFIGGMFIGGLITSILILVIAVLHEDFRESRRKKAIIDCLVRDTIRSLPQSELTLTKADMLAQMDTLCISLLNNQPRGMYIDDNLWRERVYVAVKSGLRNPKF